MNNVKASLVGVIIIKTTFNLLEDSKNNARPFSLVNAFGLLVDVLPSCIS